MKRCFAIIVAVVVFDQFDVGIFLIFLIGQCLCFSRCYTLCTRRRPRKRSGKTVLVPVCTPALAPTGTARGERFGTAALAPTCNSALERFCRLALAPIDSSALGQICNSAW